MSVIKFGFEKLNVIVNWGVQLLDINPWMQHGKQPKCFLKLKRWPQKQRVFSNASTFFQQTFSAFIKEQKLDLTSCSLKLPNRMKTKNAKSTF